VAKAELKEVREFFESDGGPKLSAAELMATKKDKPTGQVLIDYDQIAEGIGDGTFDYKLSDEQKAAAQQIDRAVPQLRG
jgi:hypothetical protein